MMLLLLMMQMIVIIIIILTDNRGVNDRRDNHIANLASHVGRIHDQTVVVYTVADVVFLLDHIETIVSSVKVMTVTVRRNNNNARSMMLMVIDQCC